MISLRQVVVKKTAYL